MAKSTGMMVSRGLRLREGAGTFFESSQRGSDCVERSLPEPVVMRRMQESLRSTPWRRVGLKLEVNCAGHMASRRKWQRIQLEIGVAKTLQAEGGADGGEKQKKSDDLEGRRNEVSGI